MRFANVRFSREILPALKEKNRRHDGFELRANVVFSLGLREGWGNAEIVIPGIKFRRHLQRLLSIVEVSNRCSTQPFKRSAVGIGCFPCRFFPKVTHFELAWS